jgi:hypothetical protein
MKPTYEDLSKGLVRYSMILHELEKRGVELTEEQDNEWAELTVLEQGSKQ